MYLILKEDIYVQKEVYDPQDVMVKNIYGFQSHINPSRTFSVSSDMI